MLSVGRIEEEIDKEIRCENIRTVVTMQNRTSKVIGVLSVLYCISIIATIAKPAMSEDIFADVCSFDFASFSSVHADNNSGEDRT